MRILLVGTCLGVGGAEKVIVDLADSYQQLGHETGIVALRGATLLRPKSDAVRVLNLDAERAWHAFAAAWKLCRHIASFKPDVVHAHLFHAIMVTRLARFFVRIPFLVGTAHSTRVGGTARRWAYRLTERSSDVFSTVSREAAEEFVRTGASGPDAVQVVYNGISLQDFWRDEGARDAVIDEFALPPATRIVVAVGRLSEPKDYPNLLRAIARVREAQERVCVLIAGEGPLRDRLRELSVELGLADCVRFIGLRSDVRTLLSAADVFVLSSAWEGFPMAVGEAMACECVVVATDCGGVQEFVGSAGFIVPPGHPVALAEQIMAAFRLSPGESRTLGRAARSRIRELFSLEAAVQRWLGIYARGKQ